MASDSPFPTQIELVEVGPRDGLQNESTVLSVDEKVEMIRRLEGAGARRIEVVSFVNARRVPQMADAEAVLERLPKGPSVRVGLVLNRRGAERALATAVDELGVVCVASDAFGMANQQQTSRESMGVAADIVAAAQRAGRRVQLSIAVAFGCPFAGEVDADYVLALAREAAALGVREVSLADTIGVAVPRDVDALVRRVVAAIAPIPVRVHFHDTRSTGIANVWAALGAGATIVDASVAGLGGCPFAPGAAGNVATEDVAYMLARSGIHTGYDQAALQETARFLSVLFGRTLAGKLSRVPPFPMATSAASVAGATS